MNASIRRRWQAPLTVLFCGLVLLTFAQRRLAELDFDSTGVVRIENNDKLDGDEIFNQARFRRRHDCPPGTCGGQSLPRWPHFAGSVLPWSRHTSPFRAPRSSV